MELYGFMEREKKIPSYFFIITKRACFIFKLCIFFTLRIASLRLIHSFFMCFSWVLLGNKNSVYHYFSRDKRYLLYL